MDRRGVERHHQAAQGDKAGTGGRRLTRPASLEDGLNQFDRHCREWLKRYDAVWSGPEAGWLALPAEVEDPGALAGRLDEVRGRLRRLALAALGLEARLGAVETELQAGRTDRGDGGRS